MTFTAQNNRIKIEASQSQGGGIIFDTQWRMPHIISSISGTFVTANASVVNSFGTRINSQVNIVCDYSAAYTPSNSLVWGYIKPIINRNRTEIDTGNPIFVSGTIMVRIYIQASGYRGGLMYTPKIWNGAIGWMQEHTYNYSTWPPPVELRTDIYDTVSNPHITFAYSLFYGRYI